MDKKLVQQRHTQQCDSIDTTSTANTWPAPSQSLAVNIGVWTKQKPSLCTRQHNICHHQRPLSTVGLSGLMTVYS